MFRKHPLGKYGVHSWCKDCEAEYKKENMLLAKQNGVCPGCGVTSFNDKSHHLAVDHNHETGELCLKCNRILGLANDSPSILRALADYLEQSG